MPIPCRYGTFHGDGSARLRGPRGRVAHAASPQHHHSTKGLLARCPPKRSSKRRGRDATVWLVAVPLQLSFERWKASQGWWVFPMRWKGDEVARVRSGSHAEVSFEMRTRGAFCDCATRCFRTFARSPPAIDVVGVISSRRRSRQSAAEESDVLRSGRSAATLRSLASSRLSKAHPITTPSQRETFPGLLNLSPNPSLRTNNFTWRRTAQGRCEEASGNGPSNT